MQTVIDQIANRFNMTNRMIACGSSYYSCEVIDNNK